MGLFGKKELKIYAPVDGKIIGLDKVEDDVFKEKMMGDGFAIDPSDGELVSAFPTMHAYGIKTKEGVEILVHIGLDTVNLKGEGFKSHVKQGQKLKTGDKLVDVDFKAIGKKIPSKKTPIVFTNQAGKKLEVVAKGDVKKGDLVAILK